MNGMDIIGTTDRDKFTGLGDIVSGMSLRDLHDPFYISTGSELCRDAKPGEAGKRAARGHRS